MNRFIKKCGTVVESETFIKGPELADGYEWRSESDFKKKFGEKFRSIMILIQKALCSVMMKKNL